MRDVYNNKDVYKILVKRVIILYVTMTFNLIKDVHTLIRNENGIPFQENNSLWIMDMRGK